MTIADILIIYLSFGAPYAVYHFIHGPKELTIRVVFDTLFHFLLWLPLLIRFGIMAASKTEFATVYDSDAAHHENIRNVQAAVAERFRMSGQRISIHEFCEILDRYVGLSLLVNNPAPGVAETREELFAIAGRENVELSSICLERRNRSRLIRHHTGARKDFLNSIEECSFTDRQIVSAAIELAGLLKDESTILELTENLYIPQSALHVAGEPQESIWIPETPPASKGETLTVNP